MSTEFFNQRVTLFLEKTETDKTPLQTLFMPCPLRDDEKCPEQLTKNHPTAMCAEKR